LIERLWGFAKRQSVYGKYHVNFASLGAVTPCGELRRHLE
jgi:hypothetical protein